MAEGLTEVLIECGRQRMLILQLSQIEPLAGEVGGKGSRTRIRKHAACLAFENGGLMQLVLNRQIQQFIVRDAAPEKKRKAGCELQIADSIRGSRGHIGGFALEAENEAWIDEHA